MSTGGNPLALLELGEERLRLADLPPGAPLAARTSLASVYLRLASGPFRSAPAMSSCWHRPSTAGRCRCWPGPRRCSGWTCPTSFAPRLLGSSRCTIPWSYSGTRSPGPPSTAMPRRTGGVRYTVLWPAPSPTLTPTAVPGTLRSLPSAPTTRRRRRSSRPASARASAAPTRFRPERSSVRPAGPRPGPAGPAALMPQPTPLGSAASRSGPRRCWARPDGTRPPRIWPWPIESLRGHIATRRGPVTEAQQILLAAAEQAAPIDPERAVVMLAEL